MKIKGLIYCRVSSKKQVKEGNGLSSQEKRCRDYATQVLGVEVENVFNDEGVSGGLFERKSIQELFKYIDSNKKNNFIVIFEDLNRLSRDIQVHGLLKAEFKKRGVELACPNFKFEESPEGDFKENISVIVSQYEKDKNKQRVLSRMKARLEQGFWYFRIPIGYKYIEAKNGGRIIVKDTEVAKIIKKGLEKYAEGILYTLSDLLKYYHRNGVEIKGIKENGQIYSTSHVHRITTNVLYTGYLESEKWDIPLTKAQHEAIISLETYEIIQKRLIGMSQKERKIEELNKRSDISDDFPLRGFLYCEDCGNMFSSGRSRGRSTRVAYYTYPRNSPMKGKSINRNIFDKEFRNYLSNLTPNEEILNCFEKIFLDIYKNRNKIFEKQKIEAEEKLKEIDIKIDNYIERIGETTSLKLIQNYEGKIEILEKDKENILEKMTEISSQLKNVGTNLKAKLKIVGNALSIRNSTNIENKKILIKMIFPEGIPINKKRVVGTPSLSLIYQAFELSKVSQIHLVMICIVIFLV
ncbi:MAG: recombinase family protein [Candidatus Gracilibacteria bacterium]|nr:recombinase family protein [Candidatus Gracilibacteria bacterium]